MDKVIIALLVLLWGTFFTALVLTHKRKAHKLLNLVPNKINSSNKSKQKSKKKNYIVVDSKSLTEENDDDIKIFYNLNTVKSNEENSNATVAKVAKENSQQKCRNKKAKNKKLRETNYNV